MTILILFPQLFRNSPLFPALLPNHRKYFQCYKMLIIYHRSRSAFRFRYRRAPEIYTEREVCSVSVAQALRRWKDLILRCVLLGHNQQRRERRDSLLTSKWVRKVDAWQSFKQGRSHVRAIKLEQKQIFNELITS